MVVLWCAACGPVVTARRPGGSNAAVKGWAALADGRTREAARILATEREDPEALYGALVSAHEIGELQAAWKAAVALLEACTRPWGAADGDEETARERFAIAAARYADRSGRDSPLVMRSRIAPAGSPRDAVRGRR